jgi:diguanylate cyclase (GGDEF)-like protein/PAS domain S-box-containing protein
MDSDDTPPAAVPARPAGGEALRIALAYAGFAALWILLSDRLLGQLVADPAAIATAGTVKGGAFVLVTSLLLYLLVRRQAAERKLAEQRRQDSLAEKLRSLNLLDAIAEGSTDAIFVKDRQGRYLLINRAASEFLGRPASEVLGRDDQALLPPAESEAVMAADRQVMAADASLTYEDEDITTPRGKLTFLTTKGPLHDESGQVAGLFGIARDITGRKRTEQALREGEARYRTLFEAHPLPMWVYDTDTLGILAVNDAAIAHYGYGREEFLAMTIPELQPHEEVSRLVTAIANLAPTGVNHSGTWRQCRKDGSEMLMEITSHSLDFGGRRARAVLAHDITEREHTRATIELNAKVFEQGHEGIVICNAEGRIVTANRAACETTGYSLAELVGKKPAILRSGRHDREFYRKLWAHVEAEGHWQGEIWNRRKSGEIYPEWLTISTVRNGEGKVTHYIGIASDITAHKEAEAHIRHLAHYDALTGLPNRSLLTDRMEQAISLAQQGRHALAVLFLDIDRFKNINDSLGHQMGDRMLVEVAERLHSEVRGEDTVSRLGGDEFVVLLPNADTDGAAHVADKIIRGMADPFVIWGVELSLTPSIGIAMYPADGQSTEALLQCADVAMYRAKEGGRNTFRFFAPEMHRQSSRTLQLENALRRALERDQLRLEYQPQVDLASGRIIGCEALLRWHHPELGVISPAEFIPVAEDTGLILPIGEWVLRTAVNQNRAWQAAGLPPLVVAVNISALQFHQTDLAELVSRALLEGGLAPEHLELELTESITMKNPESAVVIVERLRQRGIRLSIDDFGTGYSSLSYLKRLAVAKLKIDQSFIRDIAIEADSEAIVSAVINLARSLGLQTIAEGVETDVQLAFLRAQGCQQIQGYHVSRPLPAAEFAAFLHQWPVTGAPGSAPRQ